MAPRDVYRDQKHQAEIRGIPFLLSYEQWLEIWLESGHWHERGCKKGQYVMARYGDTGPYERTNVKIITHADNIRESNANREYEPHTLETKIKISESQKGQVRPTISKANANRIWTDEARKNLSEAQRQSWAKRKQKEIKSVASS